MNTISRTKKNVREILIILIVPAYFFSVAITIVQIYRGEYLKNYYNFKALNNTEKYMSIDTLIVKDIEKRSYESYQTFFLKGILKKRLEECEVSINQYEFYSTSPKYTENKISVYINNLNNDVFLKTNKSFYYKSNLRSYIMEGLIKVLFFIFPVYWIRKRIITKANNV